MQDATQERPDSSSNRRVEMIKSHKVAISLVKHVYAQSTGPLLSSLFCSFIIFITLYYPNKITSPELDLWAGLTLFISLSRIVLITAFKASKNPAKKVYFWKYAYVIGAILGGLTWGYVGAFLFPYASTNAQVLIILLLSGITAGAAPLSAAIPAATIGFLITSIIPFFITNLFLDNSIFHLFNLALVLYFIFMIVLTMKTHELIKNSIILQYENDALLNNLEKRNMLLAQAATHDPLTNVANRRLFHSNLDAAIQHAKVHDHLLALYFIDLDKFKTMNDMYGHAVGDEILLTIINRLNIYFRKADMIARLGGDELAIIVEDLSNLDEINAVAAKICHLIATPISIGNLAIQISASVGVSVYPITANNQKNLLRLADQNMYYAKEKGGNQFYLNESIEV